MISTLKERSPSIDVDRRREDHRLRGLLPISPTIIRVQTPSIQNYVGYD